ncbi:MAG: hypothetical protein JXA64_05165 [Candidatus Fermentibacteraceae bacterium]|nr:hypothetical protein [Candidatus Fermentibacteraceae bacterium]
MSRAAEIFVPGRLCLFGEHTDWAGEYRREDPSVREGLCIIAGTDQGVFARAEPADSGFHVSQILPDGTFSSEEHYGTADDALRAAREPGNFHAYAAGTACLIMREHPLAGLKFRVYRRTLPLKKGLSSSAAVCVATARAFSMVNGLGLSIEEEMETAYRGELLTGSHCGRMDQACAYGDGPVLLSFDGDRMGIRRLTSGKPIYILMADLGRKKDTKRILSDLNECFKKKDAGIRSALGEHNHSIIERASEDIGSGDARGLGELMNEAQLIFDELVAPCCHEELAAPVLHEVLDMARSSGLVWGGKGVGSQGEGAAQFICKGTMEREALADHLAKEADVTSYSLTV